MSKKHYQPKGFIALSAILIIFAIGLVVIINISFRNIDEIAIGIDYDNSEDSFATAHACVEEALLQLKNDWAGYSGNPSLPIDGKDCIISVAGSGSQRTITASSTLEVSGVNYIKAIDVTVDSELQIINWQEQ